MTTNVSFEGGDLIVTRVYNAPLEDVFDAWMDTSKLKRWWGCAECTDVKSEIEPKVGGKYNHHMTLVTEHGTHEVPGFATLVEFDPPHRLAYTSNDEDDNMVVTVTFVEVEGGSLVRVVHSGIPDMKVGDEIELREIVRTGWTAAFAKLHVFLAPSAAA